MSPHITLLFPQLCWLNTLTQWTRLSTRCESLQLYPLRSWLACFYCNSVTFDVLLVKYTGTDPLTGQVTLHHSRSTTRMWSARKWLVGHVPCQESSALPENWQMHRSCFPSPLQSRGKARARAGISEQRSSLVTHPLARLSAAEQWGMEGAGHLVHEVLLLDVLWYCEK